MKKMFILLLAAGLPLNSFAKPVTEKQLATYFIDNVKTSADKNIDLDVGGINRLSVICPAKSASGTLLIKKHPTSLIKVLVFLILKITHNLHHWLLLYQLVRMKITLTRKLLVSLLHLKCQEGNSLLMLRNQEGKGWRKY